MKKIYISPSDQVKNTYAAGNTSEAIQCRTIAQMLVEALKRCGFDAMTNVEDGMQARVSESNAWGADLHICIHTNAYNGQVSGSRIFCYAFNTPGHEVCKAIMATLSPITPGTSDAIAEYPQLYEERATNAPCCYIEVDFHDVPSVAEWIISHKPEIAEAITKGVCDYYKVDYIGGDNMTRYNTLGDIKADKNNGKYYAPAIEKLLAKGLLTGKGGTGDETIVDLGEDAIRLLAVLDRAGLFDIESGNILPTAIDYPELGRVIISDVLSRMSNG